MYFIVFYFFAIVAVAAAANFLSERCWSKENWGIRTSEAFYPGFESRGEAEKYAKNKGWPDADIVRLAD